MTVTTDKPDFEDMLDAWLQAIDRNLALDGIAPKQRPLQAARDFVHFAVQEVDIGGKRFEPGSFADYFGSEWFKLIFARTTAWYRGRYGEALDDDSDRTVTGCVLVADTPFAMRVPIITRRQGKPGETIWIHFPKEVEEDEDALTWIEKGPNIDAWPREAGMKARRLANEVACAIRAIQTSLVTVERPTDRVGELRDGIVPHLDRAADQIVRARPENLKHAHWDLQMACELAFKLLSEQRAGTFEPKHDLHYLYDQVPGPPPFKRTLLKNFPNWQKMAEWRYGGGPPVSIVETFSHYRTTLQIVQAAVQAAKRKILIGGASIEIRRAPFLHEDPNMYLPRPKPVAGG